MAGAVLEHEDGGVGWNREVMRRVPVRVAVRMPPIGVGDGAGRGILGSEVGVDDGVGVGAPGDAHETVAFDDAVDRDGRLADLDDAVGGRKKRG